MAIKKSSSSNKKISLVKGGKTVNGKFVANSPSSSSSSSSSKTTTPASTAQTLATIKASLQKASDDLKSGKVTGLSPSTPSISKTSPTPVTGYQGPSVVDYLSSQGQASDYASRSALAQKQGILGYTGSASQNTMLLQKLKLNTNSAVPSTALTQAQSPQDVLDKRAQLESLQTQLKSKQAQLAEMQAFSETDEDPTQNPLTDSDKYL